MKPKFHLCTALCLIQAIFFPSFIQCWVGPQQISDLGINFNPSAATSTGGNAEVVWTNGSYPNLSVLSVTYSGGSWSSPTTVSDIGVVDNAHVGVDALGNAVAVWTEVIDGTTVVNTSTKLVGNRWSSPTTITTASVNYNPVIAINNIGNVVVGWLNFTTNVVQVAHMTIGGAWSLPITISTLSGPKDSLSVGIDSLGNCYALWREYDGCDIYAANSTGAVWGAPIALSVTGNNQNPVLSVGAVGEVLAAWTNIELLEIRASWYTTGNWSLPPRILSSEGSDNPVVASLSGDGFASWINNETTIQVSNYTSGTWSYPVDDISSGSSNGFPSIAMDSTNTGIIVWSDLSSAMINSVSFPTGGVPGAPVTISDSGLNYSPQVVSAGAQSVAVWNNSNGDDWFIFANIN